MLGSITRDPIFCSKARILLQVKNIVFMSLMITKRLLDVVSCEFEKKMFKESRSRGSTEGPVKFLATRDLLFGQKKLSFTGTGFKPTFLEISFIIQRESDIQIKI